MKLPSFFNCTLVLWITMILKLHAQVGDSLVRDFLERQQEPIEYQSGEELDFSDLRDEAENLLLDPVDLGRLDAVDIMRLPVLEKSELQSLYQYLLDFGPMTTLYELLAVPGFNMEKIRILLPFLTCESAGKPSVMLSKGKISFECRMYAGRILEKKAGYLAAQTGTSYLGDPWKERVNLKIQAGPHWQAGLQMRKDAGEGTPEWNSPTAFDDQAGYVSYASKGMIRKIVVGHFGLGWGQGLTLNPAYSPGSGLDATQRSISRGLFPSTSVNKPSVMRGLGTELKAGPTTLLAFYSSKMLDASLADSSNDPGTPLITGIPEGSYHRTPQELSKKNRVPLKETGICIRTGGENWKTGLSVYHRFLMANILPADDPVHIFSDTQQQRTYAGWDYQLFFRKVVLYGELSLALPESPAWIFGVDVHPSPLVAASLRLTGFSADYQNPATHPGLYASSPSRETGIQLKMTVHLSKNADFSLRCGQDRFGWLRYLVSAPSQREFFQGRLCYIMSKDQILEFSGQMTKSMTDEKTGEHFPRLVPVSTLVTGFSVKSLLSEKLRYSASFKLKFNALNEGERQKGMLICQELKSALLKESVDLSFQTVFFQTDSYQERLYCWAPEFQGMMIMPSYYGKGMNWSVLLRSHFTRQCELSLKYSRTTYRNVAALGSGLEEIRGPVRSEAGIQMRITLQHSKSTFSKKLKISQ